MRLTEAFRRHGVELINPQWTNSTVSDEPPRVILEPEQIGMPRVAPIGFQLGTNFQIAHADRAVASGREVDRFGSHDALRPEADLDA